MENQIFENNQLLTDDELLEKFFNENRVELDDDGFSERVMEKLPQGTLRLSRLWTLICSVVGIGFFIWADGFGQLKRVFQNSLGNIEGFVSSIDFSNISPMMLMMAALVGSILVAWNLLADWERV
ncbi:MAG: DUF5056 domain-containing protein [Prevotella sp.]|nr:DUF5056 domain-containing protein [Prevotella sp.]